MTSPRKRSLPKSFPLVVLSALILLSSAGLSGCRTIRGLLYGNLSADDIARDIAGIHALTKAAKEANRAITPEDEYFLGRAVAVNILSRFQYQYLDYSGAEGGGVPPGLTTYLYQIGSVLAAAAENYPSSGDRDPPLAGYHFVVLSSPEINAFAAPGGFVFVTTGMLRMARSEDELASILAHEMSHVLRGHGVHAIKKARKNRVWKIMASEAAAGVFGDYSAAAQLLNIAVADILDTMVIKGYSRKAELEADWRATRILYYAGYNPWALNNVLRTMHNHQVGTQGGFYATHPRPQDRMKSLAKVMRPGNYPPPPQARVARYQSNMQLAAQPEG